MGFRTLDLDDEKQSQEYKRSKRHNKFVKESKIESDVAKDIPVEEKEEDSKRPEIEDGAPILLGKVVKIDKLRIRKEPEGDLLCYAIKDEEVRILEDVDDVWYRVKTSGGQVGYCMKTFLLTYSESIGVNDLRRCKPCPTSL